MLLLRTTSFVMSSTTSTPAQTEPTEPQDTTTNGKRKAEGIVPSPNNKRMALGPAPRSVMQQRKQPEPTKPATVTPSVPSPKVVVNKDEDITKEVVRSSNITLALNEVKDPYDPAKPNDYEDYIKERKIEQEQLANNSELLNTKQPTNTKKGKKKNVGEEMLLKMGWKGKGHGIGRLEQGMAEPLMVNKSGTGTTGVIINAAHLELQKISVNPTGTAMSRVIVLMNMVGPGEVDETLEKETAAECEKYGTVLGCVAFEDKRPGVRNDEAVRIFVKFKYEDQSLKALIDLDGRFFAGRTVRADYFNEEKYSRGEYF